MRDLAFAGSALCRRNAPPMRRCGQHSRSNDGSGLAQMLIIARDAAASTCATRVVRLNDRHATVFALLDLIILHFEMVRIAQQTGMNIAEVGNVEGILNHSWAQRAKA